MRCSENVRCFLASMTVTLCVIALVCGLVTADYNTRWVGFGDPDPVACLIRSDSGRTELKISSMGVRKEIDVTEVCAAASALADFTRRAAEEISAFAREALQNGHK